MELVKARLPIIGKVKCGEVVNNRPVSLDHFIASGHYAELFNKEYGEKPDKIEVVFVSDDLETVCEHRLEIRQGKKLYAYSHDGEEIWAWKPGEDEYKPILKKDHPEIMEQIKAKAGADWYQLLRLRFLLLKIKGIFGMWEFGTRAEASSIPQILGSIKAVKEYAGTIQNIPFDLVVEKVISQKPDSKWKFPVVKLICNIGAENLMLLSEWKGEKIKGLITEDVIEAQKHKALPETTEQITKEAQKLQGTLL